MTSQALFNGLARQLLSTEFLARLTYARMKAREAEFAGKPSPEPSELAEMLGLDESVVRFLLAWMDVWDASEANIDKLIAGQPVDGRKGARH